MFQFISTFIVALTLFSANTYSADTFRQDITLTIKVTGDREFAHKVGACFTSTDIFDDKHCARLSKVAYHQYHKGPKKITLWADNNIYIKQPLKISYSKECQDLWAGHFNTVDYSSNKTNVKVVVDIHLTKMRHGYSIHYQNCRWQ